jgi:hypothetical protein
VKLRRWIDSSPRTGTCGQWRRRSLAFTGAGILADRGRPLLKPQIRHAPFAIARRRRSERA